MAIEASDRAEKRTSPRAPIELKVDYQRLNSFFADYTKNISKGGTFIGTDRPLPVGTSFDFRITLPGRPEPFHLVGEVSWIQPEGQEPGMGVRFVFESVEQRLKVHALVESLMAESLGPSLSGKLLGR